MLSYENPREYGMLSNDDSSEDHLDWMNQVGSHWPTYHQLNDQQKDIVVGGGPVFGNNEFTSTMWGIFHNDDTNEGTGQQLLDLGSISWPRYYLIDDGGQCIIVGSSVAGSLTTPEYIRRTGIFCNEDDPSPNVAYANFIYGSNALVLRNIKSYSIYCS